jgi:excisionase family DNA binding protein
MPWVGHPDSLLPEAGVRGPSVRRFLTIEEVAKVVRCEHRTVRRAIKGGELDAALIGGKWLIRPDAVDSWFESRRTTVPAPPPLPATAASTQATPTDPGRGRARSARPMPESYGAASVARLRAMESGS